MSGVGITLEPFSDSLYTELLPLAQKCWEESTEAKAERCAFYGERDFAIEPDVERYKELERIGSLVIATFRAGELLEGYVVGFLYRALHHRKILGAIGDSIYVEPARRAYAGPLIDCFIDELMHRRVQIIGWPCDPEGYVCQLLKARGFVGDDLVMEKRLCA